MLEMDSFLRVASGKPSEYCFRNHRPEYWDKRSLAPKQENKVRVSDLTVVPQHEIPSDSVDWSDLIRFDRAQYRIYSPGEVNSLHYIVHTFYFLNKKDEKQKTTTDIHKLMCTQ